jgi:cathepsin H
MFKKAITLLCATFVSAENRSKRINRDHADVVNGKIYSYEEHRMLVDDYFESGLSLMDYSPERLDIFNDNLHKIIAHNMDSTKSFKMGISPYTAMTAQERKDYYNMDAVQLQADQACSATFENTEFQPLFADIDTPDAWDWRQHGGVSPVKDQGNCGSCWTFSTVGCLESAHLLKYGQLATYSEQQLVDCAGAFENYGCNGGLPSQAFEYIYYNGGIESEDSYPYTAVDGTCVSDSSKYALDVQTGAYNITAGDEEALKDAVYQQPVSVAFQVVDDFHDVGTGVYSSTMCGNTQSDVNHAVLAVGYGHSDEQDMDYWIIKNSWGTEWGDEGFFKIQRGVNMCGIAVCNSYPVGVEELSATFLQ